MPLTSEAFVTFNSNEPFVPGAIIGVPVPGLTSVSGFPSFPIAVSSTVSNNLNSKEPVVVPNVKSASFTFHAHLATFAVSVPETVLVYFAHVPDTKVRLKMATNTVIIPNNKTLFFSFFISLHLFTYFVYMYCYACGRGNTLMF